ncbi:MAG: thioesterase family protein [Planctomycetia bacterium]|nr:thioesterase family protein [Planctomycetia bacterium]
MLKYKVYPRFGDSDLLGHVHHLSIPSWFEEARNPIFQWFNPKYDPDTWNLILARLEMDYIGQIHYADQEVEIHTWITHIGNSSFHIVHGAYLRGEYVALGGVVIVHYDFKNKRAVKIPEKIRALLEEHYDQNAPYRLTPQPELHEKTKILAKRIMAEEKNS